MVARSGIGLHVVLVLEGGLQMLRRPWPWLLGLGALSGACTGIIGDDDVKSSGTNPAAFTCNADLVPAALPLRRLSHVQYRNTIHDIIRFAAPKTASATIDALNPIIN